MFLDNDSLYFSVICFNFSKMAASLKYRLLLVEGSIAEKWKDRLGKKVKVSLNFILLFIYLFVNYLFIWLHWVLVAPQPVGS